MRRTPLEVAERLVEYLPPFVEQFLENEGSGQAPARQAGRKGQVWSTAAALARAVSEPIKQSVLVRRLAADILSALERILTDRTERGEPPGPVISQEKALPASRVDVPSRYARYRALAGAVIRRIRRKAGNPLYGKVNAAVTRVFDREGAEERLSANAGDLGQGLFRDPTLKLYLPGVWKGLKDRAMRELTNPGPDFVRQVAAAIERVGRVLAADEDLKDKANGWLRTWAADAATENRQLLVRFISETVRSWDPEATSRRIELHVGKDLQWIRINGTIVGGLAGLFIYALSRLVRSIR